MHALDGNEGDDLFNHGDESSSKAEQLKELLRKKEGPIFTLGLEHITAALVVVMVLLVLVAFHVPPVSAVSTQ